MGLETEFKFQIGAEHRAAVLRGLRAAPAVQNDFETTYFDTPDHDLRNRGMQLRLRRDGARVVQTVKSKAREAGPFAREENELVVPDGTINTAHVRDALPAELKQQFDGWTLAPQFKTRFRRVSFRVAEGPFVAEESFDTGDIVTDRTTSEISEVEIELKCGPLPAYTAACLDFLDRVPAGLQLEGKAARGFRMALGTAPEAAFGAREPLDGGTALPEAILALMRRHFAHFLDNHPAVMRVGLSESVHQMRVGIRRLRALLQSFRPVLDLGAAQSLLNEFRAVFEMLGPVREADVFLAETLPELVQAGLGAARARTLAREVERFRAERYALLGGVLAGADFSRLVVRLNDWIEGRGWFAQSTPLDRLLLNRRVADFAGPRIQALERKLMRKARTARSGTLDDWHEARIAAKKLRYAAAPLIGTVLSAQAADIYADRLSALQDRLGGLNDLNTVQTFLAAVRDGVDVRLHGAFDEAREFCRGWSIGASRGVIAEADRMLHEFETLRVRLDDRALQ